jgi:hypothetical protein
MDANRHLSSWQAGWNAGQNNLACIESPGETSASRCRSIKVNTIAQLLSSQSAAADIRLHEHESSLQAE